MSIATCSLVPLNSSLTLQFCKTPPMDASLHKGDGTSTENPSAAACATDAGLVLRDFPGANLVHDSPVSPTRM